MNKKVNESIEHVELFKTKDNDNELRKDLFIKLELILSAKENQLSSIKDKGSSNFSILSEELQDCKFLKENNLSIDSVERVYHSTTSGSVFELCTDYYTTITRQLLSELPKTEKEKADMLIANLFNKYIMHDVFVLYKEFK